MKIFFKHLFGLCEQPGYWHETVMEFGQQLPNSIVFLNAEEYHFYTKHYLPTILSGQETAERILSSED